MLITLKTLQEDAFTVEIDPLQTIRVLKEKIEQVKGENFPVKHMKLIYAGKYLLDNNRVCDYNLEEKKFVIAVIKPPKAKVVREEVPLDMTFMNLANSSAEQEHRILCADYERIMQRITELGFTRAEVEQAMSASFNDPDRAIDILISDVSSGIGNSAADSPNNDPRPVLEIPDPLVLHQSSQPEYPTSSNSILPSQERIFELFSEAVTDCENHTRSDDQMIEANHQQIFENYAELEAAGISDPHEIFSGNGPECSNSLDPYDDLASASPRIVSTGSYSEFASDTYECLRNVQAEPGEFSARGNLLDRDQEAIDRLKQLGFSDQKVKEAYFVCEKNENAAADYLFTQYD